MEQYILKFIIYIKNLCFACLYNDFKTIAPAEFAEKQNNEISLFQHCKVNVKHLR